MSLSPSSATAPSSLLFFFCAASSVFLHSAIAKIQLDVSECGKSKKCEYGGCTGKEAEPSTNSCAYLFTTMSEGQESVLMELYTKRDSADIKYIAVGFSEDKQMGDDSVTYCVLRGDGKMDAVLATNPANTKNNMATPVGTEQGTLELVEGATDDEGIYCKVRQHSNNAGQKNLARPNLQRPYFVFLAKGAATEPRVISIHALDPDDPATFPHISAHQVVPLNASAMDSVGIGGSGGRATGKGPGLTLVDWHGILMLVAWLSLSSVALYSARFLRNAWPHTTVMGLKIWFHIHRTLNFLSVILMVLSFVLIIAARGHWTGPWFGDSQIGWSAWHSLAGALALFLALTQPFGALLRCGVDHPRRPIFNWAHRSIGLSASSLALFAIFVAVWKFRSHFALADFALWLLIFFFAAILLLILGSEVLRFMEAQEHRKLESIELQTRSRGTTPSDAYYYHTQKNFSSKLSSLRKYLFLMFTSLCVGVALLLVLLIIFH